MENVEKLNAVYEEKKAKYLVLCEAAATAYEAHQAIKAMCDDAMEDMHKAAEELLKTTGK